MAAVDQQESHLRDQHRRQDSGTGPHPGPQPLAFDMDGFLPEVEHHDHEDEKHDDRAGVNDHFERGDEGGAEDIKHDRHGE